MTSGGRFDFDDGGTYCGGWEDGKAHGFGVCTGPKGQGEYAGAWHCGFEISGVYTWTSGNNYKGQWTQGKRHGVGVETKGRWVYQGEWTQGFKGRYGVRHSSATGAKFEGTWTTGLQDGYGVETYADGGTYQGQWLRGIRHGYGVRQSVPYGLAAHSRQKGGRESLTSLRSEQEDDHIVKDRDRKIDENRGGFVLTGTRGGGDDHLPSADLKRRTGSAEEKVRSTLRKKISDGLKLRKQRSTGDIQDVNAAKRMACSSSSSAAGGSLRSTVSNISHASFGSSQSGEVALSSSIHTDSNASFVSQDDLDDLTMVESYSGEWKNDKRSGFGISERSDGLKYEGEWENNRKHGYGATTFKDGTREEGKYKNNVLISSGRRSKLFLLRSSKLKDRVDNAVLAAQRAAQIALQKSDIAISRMASARSKAELAIQAANKALSDADKARTKAREYAPDLFQPQQLTGNEISKKETLQSAQSKQSLLIGNHTTTAPPSVAVPTQDNPVTQNHASHLQTYAAKAILSRVTRGGGEPSDTHHHLPTIASALVSVGLDSSAHVVRHMGPEVGGNLQSPSDPSLSSGPHKHSTLNQDYGSHQQSSQSDAFGSSRSRAKNGGGGGWEDSTVDTPVDNNRFSQLLTPTVIEDHFDQYMTYSRQNTSRTTSSTYSSPSTQLDGPATGTRPRNLHSSTATDSRAGAEGPTGLPEFSYDRPTPQYMRQPNDTSPDSGVSVGGSGEDTRWGPGGRGGQGLSLLQRRQTLPGGPTHAITISTKSSRASDPADRPKENGILSPASSSFGAPSSSFGAPSMGSGPASVASVRSTPLHIPAVAMFRSTLRKTPNMGSMPDVTTSEAVTSSTMPREEVHLLSLRRREEIRREREERDRRRQQEIVLRFGDIKDWCQQRQLLVLVIAVNISLATMFFNLLTH